MKTAILIATKTAKYLGLCLLSHDIYTVPGNVSIYVAHNSEDDSVQRLLRYRSQCPSCPFPTLRRDVRDMKFFGQFVDVLARQAIKDGAEMLVLQNDDTVVMPDWQQIAEADLAVIRRSGYRPGLLGACSNAISGPQACIGGGGPYRNGPVNGPTHCPRVVPIFALIEAKVYEEVGGLDVELPAHQFSDDALCARLIRKGYSNWMSRMFVAHAGSRTLNPSSELFRKDLAEGFSYFQSKYPDWEELRRREPYKS